MSDLSLQPLTFETHSPQLSCQTLQYFAFNHSKDSWAFTGLTLRIVLGCSDEPVTLYVEMEVPVWKILLKRLYVQTIKAVLLAPAVR